MTASHAAKQLRALADMLELSGVAVSRFAAAGDEQDVIISLRVESQGDLFVLAVNQPNAPRQKRLFGDKPEMPELLI